ncbi:unnamed protein product [Bemisia tabaci]|uniref:Acyltransferase 3 domain-containing protein n=2 Tax=Bemisia tabaci TaxID=7038 RepID=A0A9P0ADC4_BEMTA|nr:unnamed protein product [Bemisia tabaci]
MDFAPLNGMTAMSMLLIIIGHRWSFRLPGPLQNYEENESVYYEYLISIFTSHVDLLVDTFFTVSGLLMVYIIMDRLSSQSISFWKIVFFRYIRLTPVYAAVIFFAATWWYKLGSGPMWESLVGLDRANCRAHWWVNLLYLNNYIHPNDSCGFHTWFMPCEFHFSTAIIPVIFLLKRRPKRGIVLLLVALCASIVIPFCITYIGNKPPNLQFNFKFSLNPAEDEYYQSLYTKSHTRAGPYIVGALLGYVLYKHDSKKLSLKSTWLHGLFGGVVMMVAWFTGAIYYDPTYKYSVLESALYGSSVRTIWGIGLSILIYSLVVGTHTIVHSILSWKPFTLLSGLAFNAYLVNCIFPVSSTASRRAGDHFSVMNFLTEATADVVFSLSCGFVLYLLVERPFRLLFTLLLSNVQRKEEEKLSTENKQEGSIHKF